MKQGWGGGRAGGSMPGMHSGLGVQLFYPQNSIEPQVMITSNFYCTHTYYPTDNSASTDCTSQSDVRF